ncbi:MAG: EthD family reductase [Desulfuromonadaceae bacterium]|nr:EthD family reductase [Desulfuromonadaceae bacterium]MDD5107874.1 EthD family reductase [Desulfuromonadaceae bacterium]
MIKVTILYPRTGGTFFNLDYYIDNHMALVRNTLKPFGLQAAEVDAGFDEKTSPFFAIGHLLFNSLAEYETGFSAKGHELLADIPNYTDIEPVVQVSESRKTV